MQSGFNAKRLRGGGAKVQIHPPCSILHPRTCGLCLALLSLAALALDGCAGYHLGPTNGLAPRSPIISPHCWPMENGERRGGWATFWYPPFPQANGLLHTSPGQSPGFHAANFKLQAEGLPHFVLPCWYDYFCQIPQTLCRNSALFSTSGRQRERQSRFGTSSPLSAVIANGLDRAALLGFSAAGFFFRRLGLLIDVGVTAVFIALEIVRRGFAAQVAINALIIHV